MPFTPMPHQITDAAFLASRAFAGCFNGMGTGKTRTALMAVDQVNADRVVIVGPPISLHMWQAEAEDHLGTTGQILKSAKTKIDPAADIIVVSYVIATNRAKDLGDWARAGRTSVLICDESHALKSTKAKRTKAILGSGGLTGAFSHSWMLTGTPITRWNDDAIPFLFRAAPDQIKSKIGGLSIERFQHRYCIVQKKQFAGARFPTRVIVGSRNEGEIGEIMSQVATRRTLKEVATSMPDLTTSRLSIAPVGISAILKEINSKSVKQIEQELADSGEHLATLRRQLGLSMVAEAVEHIQEVAHGSAGSVLVGAWHREVIDALLAALRATGLRVEKLDGTTSAARKTELQDAFNARQIDVLVGQIGAMGVSLNLQRGGNRIVVVEEDWSPSVMDQFYARLHRIGQELPVHVDTLFVGSKLADAIHSISTAKRRSHAAVGAAHQEAAQ
jgi:hypothetical protein